MQQALFPPPAGNPKKAANTRCLFEFVSDLQVAAVYKGPPNDHPLQLFAGYHHIFFFRLLHFLINGEECLEPFRFSREERNKNE